MSGMIIGTNTRPSSSALGRRRSRPSASSVPIALAIRVEVTATTRVLRTEDRIAWLTASLPYHSVEKPVQAVGSPLLLKLNTISTTIGPYRNR